MGALRFTKVEGTGNDYVLLDVHDQQVPDPGGLARAMSDRHRGVGADGILLVGPAFASGRGVSADVRADTREEAGVGDGSRENGGSTAAASMRIFNADGSEGLMCGNGLRCVVLYLRESGHVAADTMVVDTASGPRTGHVLRDGRIELEMGTPDFRAEAVPVDAPVGVEGVPELPLPADVAAAVRADPDRGFCVSIGNPHVVLRVAEPARADLVAVGSAVGSSPALPEGGNVHLVRVVGPTRIEARPFERGSGATRACGTGAVAVAAVAQRLEWIAASSVVVAMPGGDLEVTWNGTGPARLAGDARIVYRGEWPRT